MNFGAKLKETRLARGLSLEATAYQLGVSWTTVHRWENGISDPQGNNRRILERWLSEGADSAPKAA